MKKNYTSPDFNICLVGNSDIMLGSDTDIDIGYLFDEE
jgi:hypothetical protein